MEQVCKNNPYSGQFHCEHEIGQVHYSQAKTFKCCWCGNIRVQEPLPSGGSIINEIKHGKFYTPPVVLY